MINETQGICRYPRTLFSLINIWLSTRIRRILFFIASRTRSRYYNNYTNKAPILLSYWLGNIVFVRNGVNFIIIHYQNIYLIHTAF
jgi:hypothetical protein